MTLTFDTDSSSRAKNFDPHSAYLRRGPRRSPASSAPVSLRWTDYVLVCAFTSKDSPNVAFRQRYRSLRSVCQTNVSGSHVAPTPSGTPMGGPLWTRRVRPPFHPEPRLQARSRPVATMCGPPLREVRITY